MTRDLYTFLLLALLYQTSYEYSCDQTGFTDGVAAGGSFSLNCTSQTIISMDCDYVTTSNFDFDGKNLVTLDLCGSDNEFNGNCTFRNTIFTNAYIITFNIMYFYGVKYSGQSSTYSHDDRSARSIELRRALYSAW
jgi:hypothetical protein